MEASTGSVAIDGTKTCPVCGQIIKAAAKLCYHCRTRFELSTSGYCSSCHEIVETDEGADCARCGSRATDIRVESTVVEGVGAATGPAVSVATTASQPPAVAVTDSAARIVADCEAVDVRLTRNGENLLVTSPRGESLPPDLRGRISANKRAILRYLDADGAGVTAGASRDAPIVRPGAPGQTIGRRSRWAGRRRLTPGQAAQGMIASGAFVIFACVLPWAKADEFGATVLETKPPGFLLAGIVLIVAGIALAIFRRVPGVVLGLGILVLLAGMAAFGIVIGTSATILAEGLSLDFGYYVAVFAGVLAIAAGVQSIVAYRRLRAERRA